MGNRSRQCSLRAAEALFRKRAGSGSSGTPDIPSEEPSGSSGLPVESPSDSDYGDSGASGGGLELPFVPAG